LEVLLKPTHCFCNVWFWQEKITETQAEMAQKRKKNFKQNEFLSILQTLGKIMTQIEI